MRNSIFRSRRRRSDALGRVFAKRSLVIAAAFEKLPQHRGALLFEDTAHHVDAMVQAAVAPDVIDGAEGAGFFVARPIPNRGQPSTSWVGLGDDGHLRVIAVTYTGAGGTFVNDNRPALALYERMNCRASGLVREFRVN